MQKNNRINLYYRLLHHSDTLSWVLRCIMAALMLQYNAVLRYGWSLHTWKQTVLIYPIVLVLVYVLRTIVTIPFVLWLHKFFPNSITARISQNSSIPLLAITFNVTILTIVSTLIHKPIISHFLSVYSTNWSKTFFVAVPLFFVVRSMVTYFLTHLRTKYPMT